MGIEIGQIEAIYRYPVKSMRGEPLAAAALGWHGIEGDRRFALHRIDERGEFPWLSAGRPADLVAYTPVRREPGDGPPTHVRTPAGKEWPILSEELAAEIGHRHGAPVRMLHYRNGLFDDGAVSVIAGGTVGEICRIAKTPAEVRRFRPNILLATPAARPFEEDDWVGGTLTFSDGPDAPTVAVTARDIRCAMLNLDPDGGASSPAMMKSVVDANRNLAGVYGTVTRAGRLEVGQRVFLKR